MYSSGTGTISDSNLKTNVQTLSNAINTISQLRGVSYIYSCNLSSNIGLIAQEVYDVIPEVVSTMDDGTMAVFYGNLSGYFIEGFKELNSNIITLTSNNLILQNQISYLQNILISSNIISN